jgi:hypothetical protein
MAVGGGGEGEEGFDGDSSNDDDDDDDDDEEEMYVADGSDFDENAGPVSEFKGAPRRPPHVSSACSMFRNALRLCW